MRSRILAITTFSSREFNQDTSRAKKAAARGPVFITDRGRPAHVLLTVEHYEKIMNKTETIVDLLAMPDADEVQFQPRRLGRRLHRAADLG